MAVSDQDRADYVRGLADRSMDSFARAIADIRGIHPTSAAYYLGREGKPLDGIEDPVSSLTTAA